MSNVRWEEIVAARERISSSIHRTPIMTCATLDHIAEKIVFFKCENLQKTGSFKFRGALNAILSLPPAERARGVITHSSGNHGQALALAARLCGVSVTVVVPEDAPHVKREAMEGLVSNLPLWHKFNMECIKRVLPLPVGDRNSKYGYLVNILYKCVPIAHRVVAVYVNGFASTYVLM